MINFIKILRSEIKYKYYICPATFILHYKVVIYVPYIIRLLLIHFIAEKQLYQIFYLIIFKNILPHIELIF